MSWSVYLPGATLADVRKLKPGDDVDGKRAEDQFKLARRTATQIINAGLAGPKTGRFDVSLSGHANPRGADRARPDSVKVSVSQDHVSIPPPEG